MSNDPAPSEFAKLQKVLDLRVLRAKRHYLEKRAQYETLLAEANKQKKEVDGLNCDYKELVAQLDLKNGNSRVDTLLDISNRRYWLNFDLELAQYYLDIALGDVEEAAEEMAVLKKVWMTVDAREQAVEKMRGDASKRAMVQQEIKTELELSDSVSTGGLSRG